MLKLVTLEDVIRDTIHSREEIKSNIERLLSLPNTTSYTRQISESKQSLTHLQSALQSERKRLQLGSPILSFSNNSPQKSPIITNINPTPQRINAQRSPSPSPSPKPPPRIQTTPPRT